MKSNEKRMAKKILTDQIEQQRNNCWYSELKEQMEKYEIFDEIEQIKCYKKSKWKKLVKDKIQQYVNKEYQRESKSMKKLRFVNEKQVKRKEYIEVCTTHEIENIIKMRLNMQIFKCNFKGKDKETECPSCKEEQDTTEHVCISMRGNKTNYWNERDEVQRYRKR